MNARRARECLLAVAALAATASSFTPTVFAQDSRPVERTLRGVEAETQGLLGTPLHGQAGRPANFVAGRLADGKLFFKMGDYDRASIVLSDIVDNYARHPAAPEASFWLGESLFAGGNLFGARTCLRALIARADEHAYQPFVAGALARLIEIAINTRDFDGVETYFEKLNRLPAKEVEATAAYFRAKYLYNQAVSTEDVTRGDPKLKTATIDQAKLGSARVAFEAVAASSPYHLQSRYFIGVIFTLQGQYPQAIASFQQVLRAKVTTPEHAQVVELTQLALGRLDYETQQLQAAVKAYRAIPDESPWYDSALYELAWVYLRMGDSTQAERALKRLVTKKPRSLHVADANLLRGNLLIRNNRRAEATKVFEHTVSSWGPVRQQLDDVIASHADTESYFRSLVRDNIHVFNASTMLPKEAVGFASEDADLQRALAGMSNLAQTRGLLDATVRLTRRLDGAIHAPNAANVFPDLKRDREVTTGLRNRAVLVTMALIGIEEQRTPGNLGDLGTVRAERHQLEAQLVLLPVERADFRKRDKPLLDRLGSLRRTLYKLEAAVLDEENDLEPNDRVEFAREIDELQLEVEAQRMQVGVGDPRYVADDNLRERYRAVVARERQILAAMGVHADSHIAALFGQVEAVDAELLSRDAQIDRALAGRVAGINRALAAEAANLAAYQQQLASLETNAEEVVGGVAYASFMTVRGRLYDLVLRADLGIVDVSWAEREEHRKRVEMLTRARADEIRALDEEFREIMDEPMSGGQQ